MPSEELIQRNYINDGQLRGTKFGSFEELNLGQTTITELIKVGLVIEISNKIDYPFEHYKVPKKLGNAKPDVLFLNRIGKNINVIAVKEMKKPNEFNSDKKRKAAAEQALCCASILRAKIAIASDGLSYTYIDVIKSLDSKKLIYINEDRTLNPGVLQELLSPSIIQSSDLSILAGKVWQAIWHATKEEPKQCLMTFVEIFILKFLSDNLPIDVLPRRLTFYELIERDEKTFRDQYGKTQIEYYVDDIRPRIKSIFRDKTVVDSPFFKDIIGHKTIVSSTSVINGFAFLKSANISLQSFNRTFCEVLNYFNDYGALTKIDPEFKLRLYETFLKKTVGQQKLGQFFTPRNVVKSMITMANLPSLKKDAIVMDPAAGVGGFILEPLIQNDALKNNISFIDGLPVQNIRLVGFDADPNTIILAKANTLLHLAEIVRDPQVSIEGLNRLMAEMFVLLNTNQHLGTLEYPINKKIDIILTNPPYVTKGSRIYKEEILNMKGLRNGVDLREFYDKCGLGLESLFLRYISGALAPGGMALVIVPQGMLTRTETALKDKILSECNLLASISLPRNTFFNTPQKTYILILGKRRTKNDSRPNVFCALASSIGETLDARRVPSPEDNNLEEIALSVRKYLYNKVKPSGSIKKRIRIISAEKFSKFDRWDVPRFWNDDELVELGERVEAIERISFINELKDQTNEIIEELAIVERELSEIRKGDSIKVALGDEKYFRVRRGKRVTRSDGDKYPGKIPVYSGSKDPNKPLTLVSKKWAKGNNIPIETSPIITVNANGYVGEVFVRDEECIIHDDVGIIEILNNKIHIQYLAYVLRSAISEGNYEYEAKLYSRVKDIEIDIPSVNNEFDLDRQENYALTIKKFNTLRQRITETGVWASEARFRD